jgi:hypothetical protein
MYFLKLAGGSGIKFPDLNKLIQIDLGSINDKEFAYYSEMVLKEDRINAKIRRNILRNYSITNINQYVYDYFDTSCWGFKDVHSGIYMPLYLKLWPNSKIVCIFREPVSFLSSATKLSPNVTYDIWIEYYKRIIKIEKHNPVYWICFEDLLQKNINVIKGLMSFIGKTAKELQSDAYINSLLKIIKPDLVNYPNDSLNNREYLKTFYDELKRKAVHSIQYYSTKKNILTVKHKLTC